MVKIVKVTPRKKLENVFLNKSKKCKLKANF